MKVACYEKYKSDFAELGEAAENIVDAIHIAALLETELAVKNGIIELKQLNSKVRDVLLNTTNSEPVAIVSRCLITSSEEFTPVVPILSS